MTDITYNRVDRYMMSEALVEHLERSAAEKPEVTEAMVVDAAIVEMKGS